MRIWKKVVFVLCITLAHAISYSVHANSPSYAILIWVRLMMYQTKFISPMLGIILPKTTMNIHRLSYPGSSHYRVQQCKGCFLLTCIKISHYDNFGLHYELVLNLCELLVIVIDCFRKTSPSQAGEICSGLASHLI